MKRFISSSIFLVCIFLAFQIGSFRVDAVGNVDWFLLKENESGKEWLDLGSIKVLKNNQLTVLTRYYENTSKVKDKGETNLYVMKINCLNNEFKDISINGIPQFNSKWKTSNNDELIDNVITRSCAEVIPR